MPKMTAKYAGALAVASKAFRHTDPLPSDNQEELYQALQKKGYFWDSSAKEWEYHAPEAAQEPTPLVHIRVWADAEVVEAAADEVVEQLRQFRLVERSRPYPCRPPKQFESRVYLKFLPEVK